jgi:hypothetical protein
MSMTNNPPKMIFTDLCVYDNLVFMIVASLSMTSFLITGLKMMPDFIKGLLIIRLFKVVTGYTALQYNFMVLPFRVSTSKKYSFPGYKRFKTATSGTWRTI